MERLTHRYTDGEAWASIYKVSACGENECKGPIIDRLAAYEDTGLTPEEVMGLAQAKQDGRMVVLPCKKGDVLWSFYNWPEGIYSFCVTATSMLDGVSMLNTDKAGVIPTSDVGKTVFLAREEAEAESARQKGRREAMMPADDGKQKQCSARKESGRLLPAACSEFLDKRFSLVK